MSCPVKHDTSESSTSIVEPSSTCPVKHNTAASDLVFGQEKLPNQTTNLSTTRETSTILKADFSPSHQPEGATKWVYPSGKNIFFNSSDFYIFRY